ncbi:MAG: hypothetical protein GY715_07770 [Planctomycetes bacterium]|nr:hypothetical protein [Planctomycetota bacterium]
MPDRSTNRNDGRNHVGSEASSPRTVAWGLGLLVLVAFAARMPRLTESLWYDEIAAWRDYGMLGPKAIVTTYFDPANHIAHTLLTWCSVTSGLDRWGPEIALRGPALVFSLLAVVAVGVLGRRLGVRTGMLAAAFAALAPVCVLEGVEARGYSMMIFFAAASTDRFMALIAAPSIRRGGIYALLVAVGAWAHPVTACIAAGHALWLTGRAVRARRLRGVGFGAGAGAASIVGAAVLTLLLYAPVLGDALRIRATFAASGDTPSPFGSEGVHALWQLGGSWAWWAALPGLALAIIGAASLRTAGREASGRVLAALLGLPVLLAVVLVGGTWVYARFSLFALPGALLLIAAGVDALLRRHRAWGGAALVVLVAAWGADLVTRPPRQPLRDALAHVVAHGGPDAVTLGVGLRHEVLDVYRGRLRLAHSLFHGRDLEARLDEHGPAWVVVLYPNSIDADRLELLADRGYHLDRRFPGWIDWGNGTVDVWTRIGVGSR